MLAIEHPISPKEDCVDNSRLVARSTEVGINIIAPEGRGLERLDCKAKEGSYGGLTLRAALIAGLEGKVILTRADPLALGYRSGCLIPDDRAPSLPFVSISL